MGIGLSALIVHVNKTRDYQHGGDCMPSLDSCERFDRYIEFIERHREEMHAVANDNLLRAAKYLRSLEGTPKHIPAVKLNELYKLAIRHQGKYELGPLKDVIIARIENFPMVRKRTNYLELVRWREMAKRTIWAYRKFAPSGVSVIPDGGNAVVRNEVPKT